MPIRRHTRPYWCGCTADLRAHATIQGCSSRQDLRACLQTASRHSTASGTTPDTLAHWRSTWSRKYSCLRYCIRAEGDILADLTDLAREVDSRLREAKTALLHKGNDVLLQPCDQQLFGFHK